MSKNTLPRLVSITKQGDTWFVSYCDRSKFQRHLAAQFSVGGHSEEDVKNWVRSQPKLILSST